MEKTIQKLDDTLTNILGMVEKRPVFVALVALLVYWFIKRNK